MMLGAGLIVVMEHSLFYWPPFLPWTIINDIFGAVGLVIGAMLLYWGFNDKHSERVQSNLLIGACAFWGFFMTLAFMHYLALNSDLMGFIAFLALGDLIFSFILIGKMNN